MKPAYFNEVSVESPTMTDGLRVDHPRLKEYILNGVKMGWGNEHIICVTGAPQELVCKVRHQYEREKVK